jgi:hypothetical protein
MEDLIMKKLIMFFMVLAISVPVSATIDDPVPPMWGPAGTTGMWQLNDPCWSPPSCLLETDYYSFVVPDAVWEDGVLYTSPTASETLWALIGIPSGGSYVTVHVQIAASEDIEDADQTSLEIRSQAGAFIKEIFPELVNAGDGIYTLTGTMSRPGGENLAAGCYIGGNDVALSGVIIDVLTHDDETPPTSYAREADCPIIDVKRSISVDPNVMLVYETGETRGDFGVSLINEPPAGAEITVTVDPNAPGDRPSEDITLIGGDPCDGTITMIFDANDWDVPQRVVFEAIDDDIPEPPELLEDQKILVSSSWPGHETDANFVGEKVVTVYVMDNDQANILFRVTPFNGGTKVPVTGPVQLQEQLGGAQGTLVRWRKVGIQLQVQPVNDADPGNPTSVKVNAVVEEVEGQPGGDNLPWTDPCLPFVEAEDPNCFTFTSTTSSNGLPTGCADHDLANWTTCWNVDLNVKIWGNDDAVLQAEGAEAEGDQNYQAVLSVTVIDDGGDERYADLAEDGPKTVNFDIGDNECGAYGILPMDVGNPNAATDPNYLDDEGNPLPDCYVDIYDVIEFATKWLDCSYMQDPSCESYL